MRNGAVRRLVALASASLLLLGGSVPLAAAQSATGWQAGPGAVLDNTYDGFIDAPTGGASVPANGAFTVTGWFVDKTAQGWAGADDLQVWLGSMGSGGRQLARGSVALPRPDVAAAEGNPYFAASGFSASVNGASVPAGSQTLYVYVHTGGKGWWWKSVNVTGGGSGATASVAAPAPAASAPAAATSSAASSGAPTLTISQPTRNQDVSTRSTFTIIGSISDPTNIDRVEVWINGERDAQYATLLGTVTPDRDGSWSLQFSPTKFPSQHSNLYIYAHNSVTGREVTATTEINIVDRSV